MCITTGEAELSNTILLASTATIDGRPVNVMGYQNTAQSPGPCAMVLPIPSAVTMSAANCLDMSACPGIFRKYAQLVKPIMRSAKGGFREATSFGVEIFDSGSYTVLLSPNAYAIPGVLGKVAPAKRPSFDHALFDALALWYPDYWFAACCWEGSIEAEPLLWWYEPQEAFKTHHFLPGLDGHDGGPPNLRHPVAVDHTVVVQGSASSLWANAADIAASAPEHLRGFLPIHVEGDTFHGNLKNGDWVIEKKNPRSNLHTRVSPPGA